MDNRKTNSRPPAGEKKKIPITIYKPTDEIKLIGGMAMCREILSESFNSEVRFKKETT